MDVNGTRFHLLLGEADWRSCAVEPEGGAPGVDPEGGAEAGGGEPYVAWDEGRLALTLWPRVFQFKAPPGPLLDPSARRGAGRDRFGNWYWIDDDERRVLVSSSGSERTTTFWRLQDPSDAGAPPAGSFRARVAPPAPQVEGLRGLAVTGHHYLVVGTSAPPGLLVFDLHAGGPPEQLLWPAPFAPFDMAPAPDGGLWILDRDNRAMWGLDCHLKVLRRDPPAVVAQLDDFQNRDGTARVPPRQRVPIAPVLLAAVKDPIAIEALADGTVLILDRQPDGARPSSAVHRYRHDAALGAPQFLDVMGEHAEPGAPVPFELLAHDFAVAGGRLYAASRTGLQAFAFELAIDGDAWKLVPSADYFPMRFFGAKALVAGADRPFYDFSDGFIDLVAQPRARYRGAAVVTTRILDGKEPGCVWHRLLLDAAIPGAASVEVWSRASDERADLVDDRLAWSREPPLAIRPEGPELPFVPRLSPCADGPGDGTWEVLFQRARGRWCQLRLRLTGDGTTTPAMRALRAYYPRFSYLANYLPAAYREDPESASFLDRFLALFEGFFTSIEDRMAAAQLLLDVRSAPPDALDWLAGFFGVALDPAWDDARRRLFIKHAMDFFRWRGTIRGLRMALDLAIARCPSERIFADRAPTRHDGVRVIEKFRTRRTPGVVLGDVTDLEGIRALSITDRWKPEQGGKALVEAWRATLAAGDPTASPTSFPIRRPLDATAATWTAFCRRALGFVPSATDADRRLWQDFLERAYVTPAALTQAWGASATYTGFSQVPVPSALPPDGAALGDWYRFEGVLAVRRTAHRFVVALPVPPSDTGNAPDYQERLRLAERLVALEKPAHTVFEVKFYWVMFRIGDARLAIDTHIHQGSRAPELLGPMVLGERYLAESYLAPRPPQDAADRRVLGRDPIRG
ncbi:phage tail protein [Sorangium sp. So ce1151]|uniref:phage tail protein n=1 Tax=Sorangium sp. So ce1151 TaxID=3133332 RepID=UPI003F5E2C9E